MSGCAHSWEYWDVENNVRWDGESTALNTRIIAGRCIGCRKFMSDLLWEAEQQVEQLMKEGSNEI
jgi:hypothetical protein